MIITYSITKINDSLDDYYEIELDIRDDNLEFSFDYSFGLYNSEMSEFAKFVNNCYNSMYNNEIYFSHTYELFPGTILSCNFIGFRFPNIPVKIKKVDELLETFKEIINEIEVSKEMKDSIAKLVSFSH